MKKTKEDSNKNIVLPNTKEDITLNLKVQFINTYIGDLGIFYKGNIYELPYELYEKLKNDCKEIE
jgi:hypothetical protein